MSNPVGGIHHVTLRVADLDRSADFYGSVLGFGIQRVGDDLAYFTAGSTIVALRPPLVGTPDDDRFSEYRIGVDHLAFAVPDRAALDEALEPLKAAGVETEGVETDPLLNKEYVAFRDPDNVQLELYCS
jgi:catechol 2,3-dioxygenase-like lactoylglutathione lyase family enzyme